LRFALELILSISLPAHAGVAGGKSAERMA